MTAGNLLAAIIGWGFFPDMFLISLIVWKLAKRLSGRGTRAAVRGITFAVLVTPLPYSLESSVAFAPAWAVFGNAPSIAFGAMAICFVLVACVSYVVDRKPTHRDDSATGDQ
jgi:hypothetical protein